MAVLTAKAAQVLLVFTTNRLYRKLYKTLQYTEEEIVEKGLRAIFTRSNIDTIQTDDWQERLKRVASHDESALTMYTENIRAAHEGLFLKGYVVCTLPDGYMGQDTDGRPTKRQRPRQIVVIDPELSVWVQRIFKWYVVDRLAPQRILERLNSLKVPCGPMVDGGYWTIQTLTIC